MLRISKFLQEALVSKDSLKIRYLDMMRGRLYLSVLVLVGAAIMIGSGSESEIPWIENEGDKLTTFKLPLSFAEEFGPACVSITESGQMMAFQSDHPESIGSHDIWLSHYRNGRWQRPVNAGPGINTTASEYDGKLSADGKEMLFIRSGEGMRPSIFHSTYRDGEWAEATHVGPPVSYKEHTELGAVLSRDGQRLYFSSNREEGYNGFDLYYSERTEQGWGEPVNMGPEINQKGDVVDAAISRNEDAMIVAFRNEETERMDLYITYKEEDGWSPYHNMGPRFNTPGNEACPWLGYDGHLLLVNSTWEGLLNGEELTESRWGAVHAFHLTKGFEMTHE